MRWERGGYAIETERERIDVEVIAGWLQGTYWAEGRSTEAVRKSWAASMPFGVFQGDEPVGCARVVTDGVAIAYLADVFLLPEHRGNGLGKWLMETIIGHPELATVRWLLHTRDAHGLYRQFGFEPAGERVMERPKRAGQARREGFRSGGG